MKKLHPEKLELLVRLRAHREAPFAAIRNDQRSAAAIYQRQIGNIGFVLGGGNDRQRQSVTRMLNELAADGLVRGDALTRRGLQIARSLSWQFERQDLRRALERIRRLAAAGHVLELDDDNPPRLLVPEQLVCAEYWGHQNALLQLLLLPMLAARLVVSESNAQGFVYYEAAAPWPTIFAAARTVIDPKAAEFDEALCDIFMAEYYRCRDEMRADNKRYTEIGIMPIACGELRSGRDATCVKGIRPLFEGADA